MTDGGEPGQDAAMNVGLFGSIAQGEGGLRNLPSIGELPGRLAGWLHGFFPGVNEGLFRWAACLAVIVIAALLRRPLTNLIFGAVRRMAGKARTGLDEELFSALKSPLGVLLMIWAVFTALQRWGAGCRAVFMEKGDCRHRCGDHQPSRCRSL